MRHLSAWAAAFLFFAGFFLAFFDFWGDTPGPEFRGISRERGPRSPPNRAREFDPPWGTGRGAGAAGPRRGRRAFFLRAGGAAAGLRGGRAGRGARRRLPAGRRRAGPDGGAAKNGAAPVRAQGACGGRGRAGRAVARRRGGRRGAGAHGAKSAGRRRGAAGRAQGANPPGARARRRFFWGGAGFLGRRAKKSPFLLYKEAGFFAHFSLSDQS